MEGIGEIVTPLDAAPDAYLLIVHVQPGLSTPEVYRCFDRGSSPSLAVSSGGFLDELFSANYRALDPLNDLELPAITLLPEIENAKQQLQKLGSQYTLMSGSGSAVYGVFRSRESALQAQRFLPGSFFAYTTARSA